MANLSKNKLVKGTAYGSAVINLTGSLGHLLVAIPAITKYFRELDMDSYWLNRLTGDQYIEVSALFFVTVIMFLGAHLLTSSNQIRNVAGKWLLSIAILPNMAIVITKLLLTPEDWQQVIPFALASILIVISLLVQTNSNKNS